MTPMPASLPSHGEITRPDRISYWLATAPSPSYPKLEGQAEADVAVIGAGIVGLTCAALLAAAGRDVLVIEGDRIAAGVSGNTTAKLTAGHGLVYSRLEDDFDSEAARTYAESQSAAVGLVRRLCAELSIECDLETAANFVFSESAEELAKLEQEVAAAKRAGLPATFETAVELPFAVAGAVRLADQAQFHVRRYLLALAAQVTANGGRIAESSRVTEITGDGPHTVSTNDGEVAAGTVVVATHYPIVEQGFFATRIHPRRSYVVAAPLRADSHVPGMFINIGSPTRSLRTAPLPDGRRLLLVGGEGHRVGQEADTEARYRALEAFMQEHFDVDETMYCWSTQDTFTLDGLPFIGRIAETPHLFVATGFGGWGMTNGTVAAMVISDLIQGVENSWAPLYELGRRSLVASAGRFLTENTNVAMQQVTRPLQARSGSLDDIEPGEGAVISSGREHIAVFRNPEGAVTALSATCTHMGCLVSWNGAERTWDCPCHGSRFALDGKVLHGPATQNLEGVDVEEARS